MKKLAFILLLAIALSGCRLAQRFAPTPTPIPFSEGGIPAPGDYPLSVVNGEDRRDVIVHLPPAYDGAAELPMVIVLHGGAGSAEHIKRHSQMDADADQFGFIAVYPNGSGRLGDTLLTWNAGHCCGYALENNSDDVAILSALIDAMLSHYAIDPDRVYIAGISNGGMMAYRAGAELADKVAAIAPIAASIGGQVNADSPVVFPDTPASPVAVIAFHGMQDQHVLYDGGLSPMAVQDGRIDLSVDSSISFWVKANGCDPQQASETQAGGNIIVETYSGCASGADVVLVTIVDGGHAWPGAPERLVGDDPTQDISANQMMLEFFLAHPKQD
jgi:polyhydroxybutyrate depolymerase